MNGSSAIRSYATDRQPDSKTDQAKQLVHDALVAEAEGDRATGEADLKQALTLDPNSKEAHWHLGELQKGDRWMSPVEIERETAEGGKMTEYRKVRDRTEASVDDQLKVARWCDKNGLDDEEKAHARLALQLDPNQEEAMRRLGMIKFHGQIIPKAQYEEAKATFHQELVDSKEWSDRLWKLRHQFERDPSTRGKVLSQIGEIKDFKAVPAIEKVLGVADQQLVLAAVDCLSEMKDLKATQSLIRFAVFADPESARHAAAMELKKRSPFSFVPTLISEMQAPIVAQYLNCGLDGNVAVSRFAMLQERPDGYDLSVNNEQIQYAAADNSMRSIRYAARGLMASEEPALTSQVAQTNRVNAERNKRIAAVLRDVTGQKFGDEPNEWWDWWYDQNDYYQPPEKPVNATSYDYTYYRVALSAPPDPKPMGMSVGMGSGSSTFVYAPRPSAPAPARTRCECFVAGTPVWTTTGRMPIEQVRPGELVLSQSTQTGELAYKPVLATAMRPAGSVFETHVGGYVIKSTRGHPFWVDGTGWQMAKELKVGQRLHAIDGAVVIDDVREVEPADCFNLVVADFNAYFVGDAKLLVHDNTLRGPTTAIVPGLLAE